MFLFLRGGRGKNFTEIEIILYHWINFRAMRKEHQWKIEKEIKRHLRGVDREDFQVFISRKLNFICTLEKCATIDIDVGRKRGNTWFYWIEKAAWGVWWKFCRGKTHLKPFWHLTQFHFGDASNIVSNSSSLRLLR